MRVRSLYQRRRFAAGLGSSAIFDPGSILVQEAQQYLASAGGGAFFSSSADTTVSATRSNKVYFDPIHGNDSNSGSSYLAPRLTATSSSSSSAMFVLNAADTAYYMLTDSNEQSSVFVDHSATAYAFAISASGIVFSTVDRATGVESGMLSSPGFRMTYGGWASAGEFASRGKIYANGNTLTNGQLTTASCALINVTADYATPPIIRGFLLMGSGNSAIQAFGRYREEDGIHDMNFCLAGQGDNPYGTSWRFAAGDIVRPEIARCYSDRNGNDVLYGAINNGVYDLYMSDCAIRRGGWSVRDASTHSDVFQLNPYPGDYLVQRTAIEMMAYTTANAYTPIQAPVFSIWQASAGAGDPTKTGGKMRDCLFTGNVQLHNAPIQGGQTRDRCVGLLRCGDIAQNHKVLNQNNTDAIDTDCCWVMPNPSTSGDVISAGTAATRVRTRWIRAGVDL